jgi:solute carrier family 25 (mitochondrial phosphate transporter), member 3
MLQYYCSHIGHIRIPKDGIGTQPKLSLSSSFHLKDIVDACYDEEWNNIDHRQGSKPSSQTPFQLTDIADHSFVTSLQQHQSSAANVLATATAVATAKSSTTKLYSYYVTCYVAGGASSCIRWVLNPFDLIKTRMQVHDSNNSMASVSIKTHQHMSHRNSNVMRSFRSILNESGFRGLYQGLGPNAIAYILQTSIKYGTYELFKDSLMASPSYNSFNPSVIYVASAATAEMIADVFMCPFEMIKVKIQTATLNNVTNQHLPNNPNKLYPTSSTLDALKYMIKNRHEYGFPFGSLLPIWLRQVPGTIVNFYTYEHTTQYLYKNIFVSADERSSLTPISHNNASRFLVTIISGYTAGFCSTIISHPADSIISLMNQTKYRHFKIAEIVRQVGIVPLMTKGLAPRIFINSNVICCQWALYDTFKRLLLMNTNYK